MKGDTLLENRLILVTGSSGFIGKNLVKVLNEKRANVVAIDINSVDIKNWQAIRDIGYVDIIYHLAAITYVPFSHKNPRKTYDVNVGGTLNMLELCRLNNIKKIIFTSSYVFGNPKYLPIDEHHPLNPQNPYARSKLIGEELCRAYHEDYGVRCVILRPFNIYGEYQNENFLIPYIVKQILEKRRVILKDPEPKRDFLYIDDLIDAYIKAVDYNKSDFETFNIGYGESYSVEEIVSKIIKICGKEIDVKYLNQRRDNEILNCVADITKAKEELNWLPKIAIDNGLRKIFNFMKTKTQC